MDANISIDLHNTATRSSLLVWSCFTRRVRGFITGDPNNRFEAISSLENKLASGELCQLGLVGPCGLTAIQHIGKLVHVSIGMLDLQLEDRMRISARIHEVQRLKKIFHDYYGSNCDAVNFDCLLMMHDRVSSLHASLEKAKSYVVQSAMFLYRILTLLLSLSSCSESELAFDKVLVMITTIKDKLKYDDTVSMAKNVEAWCASNALEEIVMTNIADKNIMSQCPQLSRKLPESVDDVLDRLNCNYSISTSSIDELTNSIQTLRKSIGDWCCHLTSYYEDRAMIFGRLCELHVFCDIMTDKLDDHEYEFDEDCRLSLNFEYIRSNIEEFHDEQMAVLTESLDEGENTSLLSDPCHIIKGISHLLYLKKQRRLMKNQVETEESDLPVEEYFYSEENGWNREGKCDHKLKEWRKMNGIDLCFLHQRTDSEGRSYVEDLEMKFSSRTRPYWTDPESGFTRMLY